MAASRRHSCRSSETISTLAFGIAAEANTSWLQAGLLSGFARQLGFTLEPGPSPSIRFPDAGPYDQRLGYVELPAFIGRLDDRGFVVEQQARLSERHRKLVDRGVFPIFREKTRTGLTILDRHDERVFAARFPDRIYESFDEIPPLVVDTLLFIENRELLAPKAERRNPAVEWDRLAAVLPHALIQIADPGHKAAVAARSRPRSRNTGIRPMAGPTMRSRSCVRSPRPACGHISTAPTPRRPGAGSRSTI